MIWQYRLAGCCSADINLNMALTPLFIIFSSQSAPLIRPEFPAIFEAAVHDPLLRRVASFCRHASTGGSPR